MKWSVFHHWTFSFVNAHSKIDSTISAVYTGGHCGIGVLLKVYFLNLYPLDIIWIPVHGLVNTKFDIWNGKLMKQSEFHHWTFSFVNVHSKIDSTVSAVYTGRRRGISALQKLYFDHFSTIEVSERPAHGVINTWRVTSKEI